MIVASPAWTHHKSPRRCMQSRILLHYNGIKTRLQGSAQIQKAARSVIGSSRLAVRSGIMLEIRTPSLKHTPFHFCHSAQRRGSATPSHKGTGVSRFASRRPNVVLECLTSNRSLCGAQWDTAARLGLDRVAMVCGPRLRRIVEQFQSKVASRGQTSGALSGSSAHDRREKR